MNDIKCQENVWEGMSWQEQNNENDFTEKCCHV